MAGEISQRWNDGRASYRPAGEVIRPAEYDVVPIDQDRIAKDFVVRHHYSGTYPAARFRFGLYRNGTLSGVAVFSHPCSDRVLTNVFPVESMRTVELGRLVLLDSIPGNGESFFVSRCFDRLKKEGIVGVVSFSDPVRRTTLEGHIVLPGHVGTIYQALSGIYLGRGTPRTLRILPDGTVFSDRAASKIRSMDKGWKYAEQQLVKFGAELLREGEDPSEWLNLWVPRLTRPLRHRGNHKYAWAFDKWIRRGLPASLTYPKQIDAA